MIICHCLTLYLTQMLKVLTREKNAKKLYLSTKIEFYKKFKDKIHI